MNLAKRDYQKRKLFEYLGPWTFMPHQIDFIGFFMRKGKHIVLG
jgi:hypothetical protein